MWPLYNRLLRYDAVAHRLARSASYPCPITAGTVPPGRLPLLHRVPKRLFPGSSSLPATWSLSLKSTSTSRFLGVVRASLPCPRVDLRHGSMSACFGLQATPDSYCAAFTAFVRRISTPWLPSTYARLPHLLSGSSGISTVSRFPIRSISAFRLPEAQHEPFQCFLLAEPLKFGCLLGLQATPVPFQASNSASGPPPILHPAPTH